MRSKTVNVHHYIFKHQGEENIFLAYLVDSITIEVVLKLEHKTESK